LKLTGDKLILKEFSWNTLSTKLKYRIPGLATCLSKGLIFLSVFFHKASSEKEII